MVGYGFRFASELRVGDKVLSVSGDIYEVTSVEIEDLDEPVKIYNFEVEDWHTYFVSSRGILVHNDCDTLGDGTSNASTTEDDKKQDSQTTTTNPVEGTGGSSTKPDFYVTPEGVALSTNKDYNLVSTSVPTNQGGEYFQIHNNHRDKKVKANPHTHQPKINVDPISGKTNSDRLIRITTADDINYADRMMREGRLRERKNKKDVGGF